MRRAEVLLVAALGLSLTPVIPGKATPSASAASSDIVAIVVEGTGYGHGRGMSQWGAYGWAVDRGQTWTWILDHYYGGTVMGDVDVNDITTVRLIGQDDRTSIGLVSHAGGVTWNGHTAPSMRAQWNGSSFDIYANGGLTCSADVWIGDSRTAPATFATPGNASTLAPGDTLGICQPDESLIHYRGSLEIAAPAGIRVVNRLRTEDYLRGVVPREVAASWADAGNGAGANAVRAQAVAARSYAFTQNRSGYAKTCDTTTCQAYGGAATRPSAAGAPRVREDWRSDAAVAATAGKVRTWSNGSVASTEFSASNGPRTAGYAFWAVDDALGDGTANNPNHQWTRILDADQVALDYGLGQLMSVSQLAGDARYDGIWWNPVRLVGTNRTVDVDAWTFKTKYALKSPGFTTRVVTRDASAKTFAMIGDSVGNSIAGSPTGEFVTLTDGMFQSANFNMQDGRCTADVGCSATNGVAVAASLPINLDLVVVELGYNDRSTSMSNDIDTTMRTLVARGVKQVAWVNLATAPGIAPYAGVYQRRNSDLQAATGRWPQLSILDWDSASKTPERSRWFRDHVHLTGSETPNDGDAGQAQFALWLRAQISALAPPTPTFRLAPPRRIEIPVVGEQVVGPDGSVLTVPPTATAVALNATAVTPSGDGFISVWPCGVARSVASSLNFTRGGIDSNGIIAPVGANGKVCVYSHWDTDLVVDVTGWLGPLDAVGSGFTAITPYRVADSRESNTGIPLGPIQPGTTTKVQITGLTVQRPNGELVVVPENATSVAYNVVAVNPADDGFITVWPCGTPKPLASTLNYARGAIRANGGISTLGEGGKLCVATHKSTDVVLDIVGWMTPGTSAVSSAFVPFYPDRWVDTREGVGAAKSPVQKTSPLVINVRGRQVLVDGAPVTIPADAKAVAVNVVAVRPGIDGFTTMWPCGAALPTASSINYAAGSITANNAIVPISSNGTICLHVHTNTEIVVDATGWFNSGDGFVGAVPDRFVDSRIGLGPGPI